MAYEAYIAVINEIANEAYQDWLNGRDYDVTIRTKSKEANVEGPHVLSRFNEVLKAEHLNRMLVRTDN